MKIFSSFLAAVLLVTGTVAYSQTQREDDQTQRDNSGRPCYKVNVQINRNNRANVKQNCGYNDSRTMQAGQNNEAATTQKGEENTSEVRQYEYNGPQRRPAWH